MSKLILLNVEAFQHEFNASSIKSKRELAQKIGIDYTTLWRALKGKSPIGAEFIAGTLLCFGADKFNELFFLGK